VLCCGIGGYSSVDLFKQEMNRADGQKKDKPEEGSAQEGEKTDEEGQNNDKKED